MFISLPLVIVQLFVFHYLFILFFIFLIFTLCFELIISLCLSLSLFLICVISTACTICPFPFADPLQIKGKGKRKTQITGNELESCCDVRPGFAAAMQCTHYAILLWPIRNVRTICICDLPYVSTRCISGNGLHFS